MPKLRPSILALLGILAALTGSAGSGSLLGAPAFAQQAPPQQEVPDETLDLGRQIAKLNAYTGLLNTSLRAVSSYARYDSWVDLKTGPTGKERIVYGLYEVSPVLAKRALEAAEAAGRAEPAVAPLDELAREYARAFEAVIPVANEASRYYERQDYKEDKTARGRELHARLVAVFEPFLAQRTRLEAEMKAVKTVLNQRQLVAIERREGRAYAWHVRNVLNEAEPLGDIIVQEPGPALVKPLDEAVAAFARAVRGFDDYLARPDAQKGMGTFESEPRSFLGAVREYREELAGRSSSQARFKLQFLVNHYNRMIQSANLESRLRR
jgi:Protein of unknown function (DUF3829)